MFLAPAGAAFFGVDPAANCRAIAIVASNLPACWQAHLSTVAANTPWVIFLIPRPASMPRWQSWSRAQSHVCVCWPAKACICVGFWVLCNESSDDELDHRGWRHIDVTWNIKDCTPR